MLLPKKCERPPPGEELPKLTGSLSFSLCLAILWLHFADVVGYALLTYGVVDLHADLTSGSRGLLTCGPEEPLPQDLRDMALRVAQRAESTHSAPP